MTKGERTQLGWIGLPQSVGQGGEGIPVGFLMALASIIAFMLGCWLSAAVVVLVQKLSL